ncbi:MAG: Fpg/Nei family DNA glycosylase [Solirubrobacteraceae bacterium]
MPEGDTLHYAANRIRPVLLGHAPDEIETPHRRFTHDRWPERLSGRTVTSVDAHGKHLFLRFDGDLTLHSHLRMTGSWGVYRAGQRWRRSPRRAWLVLRAGGHEVVEFDGPVLELMTEGRTRFDQRLAALGPDIVREDFDPERFIARLREDDPTRGIGDALLDQRNVAGFGNVWKAEACFLAEVDPWRPVGSTTDEEARRIVDLAQPLMRLSAERGGRIVTVEPERPLARGERRYFVYERDGLPCRRCGTLVRSRGQGDDNRTTFWCPGCQR